MHVDVSVDTRTGGHAEIHSKVESVRFVDGSQMGLGFAHKQHHLGNGRFVGAVQGADVLIRRHHQVPGGIRIQVQDDEIVMAAVYDEVFLILPLGGLLAKNARVRGVRRLDIAVAPRTPEVVHRNCADALQELGGVSLGPDAGASAGASPGEAPWEVFTRSLSSLLGLKYGMRLEGTSTRVPVFGLRPTRGWRWRVRKLPKPRISILSPA